MVVLGFHPVRSGMKYQLTTPLLFANIIRWMAPDAFRSWELTAGTVGTVDVELESEIDPKSIRVQTEEGRPLPFTVEGKTLRFFTGAPGVVRVLTGDRELVYSLTLPQPGDTVWKPATGDVVKLGLPASRAPRPNFSRSLALAGARGRCSACSRIGFCMAASIAACRAAKGVAPGEPSGEESLMTFERAWVLIFLLLPLGWMFFEWRRTRRITALVLKTLAFLAIVLALAEPTLTVPQTKMAVAVLVDTSSSVSPQDLARASEFAAALDKARGRHWVRVLAVCPIRSRSGVRASSAACVWNPPPAKPDAPPIWNPASRKPSARFPPAWCRESCWFPTARRTRAVSLAPPGRPSASAFPIDTVALHGPPAAHACASNRSPFPPSRSPASSSPWI